MHRKPNIEYYGKEMLFDESYKPLRPHTREQWAEYDKRTQYMMENKMYGSAEEFDKEMKEDFPWLFS